VTVKVSALATVLTLAPALAAVAPSSAVPPPRVPGAGRWAESAGVDYAFKPNDIAREGIRGPGMEQVQSAKMMATPISWCARRSAKQTAQ